jgi:hypothetical protein
MSSLLLNIYAKTMMMEAMEGILEEAVEEGIKIGGNLLKDVRFIDGQGMIAGSEIGLIQKIMDGLYTHYCIEIWYEDKHRKDEIY